MVAGCQSLVARYPLITATGVNRVVEVVHGAGIARKVARLTPVAVIKG